MEYEFEFDEAKSRANKAKHGIDFVEAQGVFRDAMAEAVPARSDVEPRFLCTGLIGNRHWTAVFTYRCDAIRLISVRRACAREVQAYEAQNQRGGV